MLRLLHEEVIDRRKGLLVPDMELGRLAKCAGKVIWIMAFIFLPGLCTHDEEA